MLDLPVFIILSTIAIAANWYSVPKLIRYSELAQGTQSSPIYRISATIKAVLLSLGACAVGSYMAPRAGLTTPFINSLLQFDSPHIVLFNQLGPVVASTLQVLLGLMLLQVVFVRNHLSAAHRVRAPLSAKLLQEGVIEEIVYRWGFMSVVARIMHWELGFDPAEAMIGGIVLAAAASSLAHVSDLSRLKFDCLGRAVASIFALHFWAALCYGWMFWQYGLTAAMLSHIAVVFMVAKARDLANFFVTLEEADVRA